MEFLETNDYKAKAALIFIFSKNKHGLPQQYEL